MTGDCFVFKFLLCSVDGSSDYNHHAILIMMMMMMITN